MESDTAIKPARVVNIKKSGGGTKKTKVSKLQDFLIKHIVKKNTDDPRPITHTRIGGTENGETVYGGSYHIPDEEFETFMKLYYNNIVSKNGEEYLTEKQLVGVGPIALDIDLHFALDIDKRVYKNGDIDDLVQLYLAELKGMYQFDDDTRFQVYIFEKKNINRVEAKNITKDGIHIIIGLQADHAAQRALRERMLPKIEELWSDFPIVNEWSDVLDSCISNGTNNWQLYGSKKPEHEAYKLTKVMNVSFDTSDGEWICDTEPVEKFMNEDNFMKLSVRNKNIPQYFYKSAFSKELAGRTSDQRPRNNTQVAVSQNEDVEGSIGLRQIRAIQSKEDLDIVVERFLESLSPSQYVYKEIYDYTMILPEAYYGLGKGTYAKWVRVGWALKNTSDRLLIIWIAFSAKAPNFSYSSISDLCDQWLKFDKKCKDGVTERSIMYWAMQDANDEFKRIKQNTIGYYLDRTIENITIDSLNNDKSKDAKGCGDFDIAVVLHHMKKYEFKCVNIKSNIWYYYRNHRWTELDSGTTLNTIISTELRDLYQDKATVLMRSAASMDPEDEKTKLYRARATFIMSICGRLGRTNDKKNIMTEARHLFHDPLFLGNVDSNPYLLCFANGVIDFKEKIFRRGLPEDYITKCTNIDYFPVDQSKNGKIMNEINDFMRKLFPVPELCKYMWEHLASTLIGTTSVNQTFNMYIGAGQNGKSVLTDFMSQVLGDYKVAVPVALITQDRGKIGGLAPEVVALKGARYAVMQETSKGNKMNEGVMKELVSGMEPIKARAPYMLQCVEFVPQFKLIMCSNDFPEIKTQDHGTWRRIRVVPFVSLFTDNPVSDDPDKPHQFKIDRYIQEKFVEWRPVFASMLVDIVFETNGVVKDCPTVLSASNEYRERQDYLAEFCKDKITRQFGANVRKSQLTEEFKLWYNINFGTKNPSTKDLFDYMDKNYGKQKSGIWYGIRIKPRDCEDFEDDVDDLGEDINIEEL
jgi:hypothetical protein